MVLAADVADLRGLRFTGGVWARQEGQGDLLWQARVPGILRHTSGRDVDEYDTGDRSRRDDSTDRGRRRAGFRSVRDLMNKHPFIWTKTADDILDRINRKRISTPDH